MSDTSTRPLFGALLRVEIHLIPLLTFTPYLLFRHPPPSAVPRVTLLLFHLPDALCIPVCKLAPLLKTALSSLWFTSKSRLLDLQFWSILTPS